MKRAFATSLCIGISLYLLAACSSFTTQPKEWAYIKKVSSAPALCEGSSPGKDLKDGAALKQTFSALLGASSEQANSFFDSNQAHFIALDTLLAQGQHPELVRPYLKIMHQLALEAAAVCSTPGADALETCRCDNKARAEALLNRALPTSSCAVRSHLAEELAQACQENYVAAVSSLFSSLTLARR